MLIIYGIYYLAIIGAAFAGPQAAKMVMAGFSVLIPDPLPFVEEIIIIVSLLK